MKLQNNLTNSRMRREHALKQNIKTQMHADECRTQYQLQLYLVEWSVEKIVNEIDMATMNNDLLSVFQ